MSEKTPILSIVIVTRNEEDSIRECLESVLSAGRKAGDFEVLVVDGNSTDRTVPIASTYPVTVLQTDDDVISTPSAGRHVGASRARGEYTLFVDGDTRLAEDWIDTGIRTLENDPDVAGVGGYFNDVDGVATATEVDSLWRVMLYESDVLDEIGGFDPYLRALEDFELGFRVRLGGYRMLRLPVVVGYHPDQEGVREELRRWQIGFYFGYGDVVRKYLDRPDLALRWLSRHWVPFASIGWAAVGATVARRRTETFAGWIALSLFALGFAAATRGVRWTTEKAVSKLVLFPIGFARGFLSYPTPAPDYPLDTVEVVQRGELLRHEAE